MGRHPSLAPISSRALGRCKNFLYGRRPVNGFSRFVRHSSNHALLLRVALTGILPLDLGPSSGGPFFVRTRVVSWFHRSLDQWTRMLGGKRSPMILTWPGGFASTNWQRPA